MKIFFFMNDHKVEVDKPVMTGLEIKEASAKVDPTVDVTHELVLEGPHGDTPIPNDAEVNLEHGHGEGPKHFFTRPPTSFGSN